MKRKILFRILVFLCLIACLFSIAGVSASWHFSGLASEGSVELPLQLVFPAPINDTQLALLNSIVTELNNADSAIHDQIYQRSIGIISGLNWWDKTTLGSMDPDYGDELATMFNLPSDGSLSFIIQFEKTNEVITSYTIYTTEEKLSNYAAGEKVSPVYKTTLSYDGATRKWVTDESINGQADYALYDRILPWGSGIPSFNVKSWTKN